MSAEALLSEIRGIESSPAHVRLCESIVKFMVSKKPEELRMLTFRTFANACMKEKVDAELIGVVALLVSLPMPALDAKTMLVDEDSNEFEISFAAIKEAEASGELIHPEKGYPVQDFQSKIFPFFAASEFFFAK